MLRKDFMRALFRMSNGIAQKKETTRFLIESVPTTSCKMAMWLAKGPHAGFWGIIEKPSACFRLEILEGRCQHHLGVQNTQRTTSTLRTMLAHMHIQYFELWYLELVILISSDPMTKCYCLRMQNHISSVHPSTKILSLGVLVTNTKPWLRRLKGRYACPRGHADMTPQKRAQISNQMTCELKIAIRCTQSVRYESLHIQENFHHFGKDGKLLRVRRTSEFLKNKLWDSSIYKQCFRQRTSVCS